MRKYELVEYIQNSKIYVKSTEKAKKLFKLLDSLGFVPKNDSTREESNKMPFVIIGINTYDVCSMINYFEYLYQAELDIDKVLDVKIIPEPIYVPKDLVSVTAGDHKDERYLIEYYSYETGLYHLYSPVTSKCIDMAQDRIVKITPKFKVGDEVISPALFDGPVRIKRIDLSRLTNIYVLDNGIPISEDKLQTFKREYKPYDKVLMRSDDDDFWTATFYSHTKVYSPDKVFYVNCDGTFYPEILPFEGNEKLVGTNKKPY